MARDCRACLTGGSTEQGTLVGVCGKAGGCPHVPQKLDRLSRAALWLFEKARFERAGMDGAVMGVNMLRAESICRAYRIPWSGSLLDRLFVCEDTFLASTRDQKTPENPKNDADTADAAGWAICDELPPELRAN